MKKTGFLVSICMFVLLLGGCAGNVESTPVEDSSEAASEIPATQNDVPEPAEEETELSGQGAEIPEQDIELSEQDAELINMAIHDNEHNIYTGNIGNQLARKCTKGICKTESLSGTP